MINPHDDGIGLDEYVDWLIDAGYPIERIPDYDAWLHRFETADAGPARAAAPALAAAAAAQLPATREADPRVHWPADRFRAAVQEAKIGPDKDIPHITPPIIVKYITNLQLLGLL